MKSSLDKVDATKHYSDIMNSYNSLPTTFKKVNPDLTSFVVGKAVDALFDQVAKEEANIRANPMRLCQPRHRPAVTNAPPARMTATHMD